MNRSIVMHGVVGILALALARPAPGQDAEAEARKSAEEAVELAKGKKLDEAIAAMKKAIELAPRNDLYLARASDYEMQAGKFADGLEHAQKAIRLNGKVGAYYVLAAANAVGVQDLDRAREYCDHILKGGPKEFGEQACRDVDIVQGLLLPKIYTIFWDLNPARGRSVGGTLTVALPKTGLPYQGTTFEIKGARSHRLIKGVSNDLLVITPDGDKPFKLTTKVTVRPYSYKKEVAAARSKPAARSLPQDAQACLGSCLGINPRSPALVKVASELKGKDNVETAANILAWMKKHIEYKLKSASIGELDFDTVDDIIERGHAECRGYAMLFAALCRAAGVPARPIWGLIKIAPGQDQRFGAIASHSWGEFYVPGCGWVPVDPQRPESLGFLPTSHMRIQVDIKRSKTSTEDLPMFNLVNMNDGKVKFDEARGEPDRGGSSTPGSSRQPR
jgi:tetratricopeptide (TPR) repeat protein